MRQWSWGKESGWLWVSLSLTWIFGSADEAVIVILILSPLFVLLLQMFTKNKKVCVCVGGGGGGLHWFHWCIQCIHLFHWCIQWFILTEFLLLFWFFFCVHMCHFYDLPTNDFSCEHNIACLQYIILHNTLHYLQCMHWVSALRFGLTMNLWSLGEGGGVSKKQDVCIHVMLLLALWLIWLYNSFHFNNVHPGQFLPVAVDSCMYFHLFTAINIWLEQPSTYWHSNIYIYIYLSVHTSLSLSLYIYIYQ